MGPELLFLAMKRLDLPLLAFSRACDCPSPVQVSMAAAHGTASGPTVTLVQLPNGQTVQVHGVIQAAQPSVIQSPQVQAVQVSASLPGSPWPLMPQAHSQGPF